MDEFLSKNRTHSDIKISLALFLLMGDTVI